MIGREILNYRIISLIGEGGMGSVYLAEHQTLGRKAAIKVLLPELARNQMIRDRFINEARTLSLLNHQNIVTLYDFSDVDGNLLLVMEYTEGTPLDTVIEKITGAIPEQRCLNIFRQVLEGFSYAHRKGIVHRDIKPANIILQGDDTPKILDFGIAKIVEGDVKLTKTGTRMGSVVYMSPEQVMGRDVDQRSDIYSLGVTLFEMLTGRLPYDTMTESEFDIQTKIVREPLPAIRNVNPNISENLEGIIAKATEKDVNYRFQNCDEFIKAFEQSGYNYSSRKTVIQQPAQNKTVIDTSANFEANKLQPKTANKTIFMVVGGFFLLFLLAAVYYYISSDDKVEKKIVQTQSAKPISDDELKTFINTWLGLQNNKEVSKYLSLYAPDFNGVKRTKSGKTSYMNFYEWGEDRRKMYENAVDLNISIGDINIIENNRQNATAKTEFIQYYSSAKYQDVGKKIINLKRVEDGSIKIVYEEMVYSSTLGE